jgi:hypothetical protein
MLCPAVACDMAMFRQLPIMVKPPEGDFGDSILGLGLAKSYNIGAVRQLGAVHVAAS